MTTTTICEEFRQAMIEAGLMPPKTILADGRWHRFATDPDDSRDTAGYYKLYSDGLPAGAFGCHRSGLKQKWCSKPDTTLTEEERRDYRTRIAAIYRQRDAEEQRRHAAAATRAQREWEQALLAPPEYPYLVAKQIQPHDLRLGADGRLLAPMRINGVLTSLQYINATGDKRFLSGGEITGSSSVLGDLSEANTILICEGFATASSLFEATGYPAIIAFYAANLTAVAQQLRHQYPTATIVLCGDNDLHEDGAPNTGFDHARTAATAIEGRVAMPDLGGKKCDWNDVAHEQGSETVRKKINAVIDPDPPVSFDTPAEPWPVLNDAARHGLAGEVVALFDPHTEADPAAVLVSFLSEVGTMLGRTPHLILDGSYHPLLFWPITIGTTSKSRKGTATKKSDTICQLVDSSWTRGLYKGTPSTGEGLAFAVRDAEYRDDPVKVKGRATGETDRICIDPGVTDKRLHLVVSEFGAMLRTMHRDGNSLSGVLRDAWDGLDLCPMTKGSRVRATAPHISLVGHVTTDELLRNLDDTEASNGFGNRFVWFLVRRSKELPFPSAPDAHDLDALAGRLGARLRAGRLIGRMELDASAREAWRANYHDLSRDRPGLGGTLLGRAEAQVMRLSALYAVLDGTAQISVVHMRAALAVWIYAEQSVEHLFGDRTGDPDADTILAAIREKGPLTDTAISALFAFNRSKERLDHAKAFLQTTGLIASSMRETGGRGRPVQVWRATVLNNSLNNSGDRK